MTRLKIEAFFREFPFLSDLFDEDSISRVSVSRVNEEVRDEFPKLQYLGGAYPSFSLKSDYEWERIILLNKEGHKILEVGVREVERQWYRPSTWKGRVQFHESVAGAIESIHRSACPPDIYVRRQTHFIVKFEPILRSLTLLKSPKGFTVEEWFVEIRRRDDAEIQAANAEVDKI